MCRCATAHAKTAAHTHAHTLELILNAKPASGLASAAKLGALCRLCLPAPHCHCARCIQAEHCWFVALLLLLLCRASVRIRIGIAIATGVLSGASGWGANAEATHRLAALREHSSCTNSPLTTCARALIQYPPTRIHLYWKNLFELLPTF